MAWVQHFTQMTSYQATVSPSWTIGNGWTQVRGNTVEAYSVGYKPNTPPVNLVNGATASFPPGNNVRIATGPGTPFGMTSRLSNGIGWGNWFSDSLWC
jgi:hypothetical protein